MSDEKNEVPPDFTQLIDRLADEFEEEFKAGNKPQIEDYLKSWPEIRAALLRELLFLEIEMKQAAGEQLVKQDYLDRFPGDCEIADIVLPQLVLDETHETDNANIPAKSAAVPRMIGRYFIERELGSGGFGVVYLAQDSELDRSVALKVPRLDRFHSNEDVAIFTSEARVAAQLKHPSLVTVFDIQVENGQPYIVQEFIDGENLATIIRDEGPLPLAAAALIVIDVAEGLQHVHANGYQHLDVKPQNIMISRLGKAVLTDFGLAVSDEEKWECGSRGTVIYMAPEQLRSESGQLDGRTDIWSLGVVFYEMLTKKRPFQGGIGPKQFDNLIHSILDVQPKPPSQWQPNLPKEVDKICLRCLEKRIEGRYQSAAEFVNDVRAHIPLQNNATGASQDSLEDKSMERRRDFVATECVVVAIAVTGLILVILGFSPRRFRDLIVDILLNSSRKRK